MISEPSTIRSRSRIAALGPVAGLLALALALAGCSAMPKTSPPPGPDDPAVKPAWLARGQSPDQLPPPPEPGAVAPLPALPDAPATQPSPGEVPIGPVAFPEFAAKSSPGDAIGAAGTVGCATCGGVGQTVGADGLGFHSCSSCSGSGCVPGRKACYPYQGHTFFGRFCADLYASLCCPDPCYEPGWVAAANAAFFVDYARPRTVMRFRNDYGWDLQFPDRNEFFWAREQIQRKAPANAQGHFTNIPGGTGPGRPNTFPKDRPFLGQPSLNFDQFSFYTETAANTRASVFVEIPYRTVSPRYGGYHAGFADMNVGTKGVILDTEILLLTIQFRTYIPIGNVAFGLGNGHVSLEPSLLGSLKLGPNAYLQGQVSEWIPIGGDNNYQGAIIHYHGSYNQVLARFSPNSPLIATFEGSGYTFQDGAYTNPPIGPYVNSSGSTYFSVGPGLRAVFSDAIDLGAAVAIPVSSNHWGDPILRVEFRILY